MNASAEGQRSAHMLSSSNAPSGPFIRRTISPETCRMFRGLVGRRSRKSEGAEKAVRVVQVLSVSPDFGRLRIVEIHLKRPLLRSHTGQRLRPHNDLLVPIG